MITGVRLHNANADDHKRLPYLQVLRAIAATLVVLEHSHDGLVKYNSTPPAWTAVLASLGYFGVATFFIISGFIIFRVEYHSFNTKQAIAYLKKRLIRIYPIYWIATIAFIVLDPKLHHYHVASVVSSFILLPHYNAITDRMFPLLGQGWTLQYEIVFYLLFFVALFFPRRLGVLFLLTALAAAVVFGNLTMPILSIGAPETVFQYWTRPIILLFGGGVLVGWLERGGRVKVRNNYPLLLLFALIIGYAVTVRYLPNFCRQTQVGFFFAWPFCFACVLTCVFAPEMKGRAGILATRLGDASYSTYLFHTFIISFLLRLHLLLRWPLLLLVLAVILSNALGLLCYNFIERPMLRKLRKGPKQTTLATASG